MKQILPYLTLVDDEKKKQLSSFCSLFNDNLDNLTEFSKNRFADFLISVVTGIEKENINPFAYNELVNYIISNIGMISISYYQNYIKEIKVGNITCGGVFADCFDNIDLSNRIFAGKACYGAIPTSKDPLRLRLVYDDKKIVSSRGVSIPTDRDNVHIGSYYFNRKKILNGSNLEFVNLTEPYDNQLSVLVKLYDADGNLINQDVCVNYLEVVDSNSNTYTPSKQVYNELENINDLRKKM